ncbi:MAG: hypothetical protein IJ542_02225 [Clostridia bacterium]|nr:hypothetical protein [Clostridia bacterium]
MNKIKTSLFGYNKSNVNDLIKQKEEMIETQQKDIDYLQKENNQLKSQIKANKSQNITQNQHK